MTTINTVAPSNVHNAIAYLHKHLSKEAPVPAVLVEPVVHVHGTGPLARALLDRLAMRAVLEAPAGPLATVHIQDLIRYRGGRNRRNWSLRRAWSWLENH